MNEEYNVKLKVNDKDVGMNQFVVKVMKNVIFGIIKSLTLKEETIERVDITIESDNSETEE